MERLKANIYNMLPCFTQNFLISWYGTKLKKERFSKKYYAWQEFLEKSQYFSLEELRSYQNQQLRIIINHAFKYVPYYRNIFNSLKLSPEDIKSASDLIKLPILTKDSIRKNFKTLISAQHDIKNLQLGHTSGTTGSPLEFYWDQNVNIAHNVFIWRHRNWAGFHFGKNYATLLGRTVVPIKSKSPPFYRINSPWNQYLFSSFHLSDTNINYYFDAFDKFQIRFMEAYPSTAYILAKYLQEHNLFYKMEAIVTSSETLLPLQREIIEERFNCKVYDYYGMAERVMFAGECKEHNGHHLHMEYGITEILDEENNPVAAGNPGKLILTGLHNLGMPLIRYEIGDVGALQKTSCTCGRTLPLLSPITTKAEDVIVKKDGSLISSSILTHPFKPMHNIEKSQIIQNDYDKLTINIVKRPSYSEKDSLLLIDAMQKRVGSDIEISINFVSDIPRGKTGKYRWVVSKVPLKFGAKKIHNLYED